MTQKPDKEVTQSLTLAKSLRQPYEGRWQRLMDLTMPERTSFFDTVEGRKGDHSAPIYDETGSVSLDEFANRLQEGIFPAGVEWARLEAPPPMPDEFRAGLADVQRYVFQLLDRTNLAVELPDGFKDLAGPGNICLKAVPGDWQSPITWQAIPLADSWVTPGKHGTWRDIHVRYRLPRYVVMDQYPRATFPDDWKQTEKTGEMVALYDSWLRDPQSVEERWRFQTHVDSQFVVAEGEVSGQGSCAYIFGRWTKAAGELYGSGQGMKALPAIMVANDIVRQVLSHADMALAGMWQAEDDGVLNPWTVKLMPGVIIPKAPGSPGLQPLQPPSTRLDIGNLVLEEQRHNIRKALYAEALGKPDGTPPSAFEVQQRMAELARQIGPAFLRVWHEVGVGIMQRTRWLLQRRGLITMPMIDGRKVKIASASAVVRAAAAGDVRRINEWLAGIGSNFGAQTIPTMVSADRYMRVTGERLDIPASIMFSPQEQKANAIRTGELLGKTAAAGGGTPAAALAPVLAQMGGAAA